MWGTVRCRVYPIILMIVGRRVVLESLIMARIKRTL